MSTKIINKIYKDINKQLQIKSFNNKLKSNNCKKYHIKMILKEKTQINCKYHKTMVQKIQIFHKALLKLQI